MKMPNFGQIVHSFFVDYLSLQKGLQPTSIQCYRDVIKLLLCFAADRCRRKVSRLTTEDFNLELVQDFLNYLERERGNHARTRNHRLAAIKSLARMIRFMVPQKADLANMILAIPQKRAPKTLIGFLYPDEVLKIYRSVDLAKSEGLRDYTLLHLLYDTGARASEAATLNLDYFDHIMKPWRF